LKQVNQTLAPILDGVISGFNARDPADRQDSGRRAARSGATRANGAIMAQRSNYQDRIIKNYYKNQDQILLQRLGDYVADLYLAQGKAREHVWKNVVSALTKLRVPDSRIEHLRKKDDAELLAGLLKELLK
jgi:hypothetical protein